MRHVILSPHFDDAIFSCYSVLKNKDVLVINVFAGAPLHPKYKLWDLICGHINSTVMMNHRTNENKEVFDELGVKFVNLDNLENQYTKSRNIKFIEDSIRKNLEKDDVIYAPIAKSKIYKHPDHLLVRSIANNLSKEYQVKYYLDLPYMNPRLKHSNEEVVKLENKDIENKFKLSKKYKTQYSPTNLVSFGNLGRGIKSGIEKFFNSLQ